MVVIQSSEMTSLLTPKWFLDPSHFLFLWPVEGTTKWRVGNGEPLLAGNTRVARVTFFPHVEYKINISAKNTSQVPQWIGVFVASLNVTWLNFADDNWQLDYISQCIYFLALGFAQLKRALNIYYAHKFLNLVSKKTVQVFVCHPFMGQLGSTTLNFRGMQCGNYVYAACRAAGNCRPYGPLNMNSPHFRRIFNHTHTHTLRHTCERQVANYSRLLIQKQRQSRQGRRKEVECGCTVWHAVDPFPKVKFSIEFPLGSRICYPFTSCSCFSCCRCSYMRAILVDISSDNNLQSNHLSTHSLPTHTHK